MSNSNDLESFRYTVRQLIEVDSPIRIDNSSAEHAKIVFTEMFKSMKREAFVFCGNLCREFWSDAELVSSIRDSAKRDGVERIVFMIQNRAADDEDCLKKLVKREGLEKVVEFLHKETFSMVENHFAVFDRKRYRFETDGVGRKAFACANNTELAVLLTRVALKLIAA